MSKKTKAIAVFAVCTLMLSSVGFSSAAAGNDVTVDGESMYNDYIKISCDDDGGLRMYTTNGDPDNPNDDDKRLLYGLYGSTSHNIIYVDGRTDAYDYMYSSEMTSEFDAANKTHVSTKSFNGVDIRQNFTFVRSNATGRDDMVEIKYTLTNNDTVAHEAGVRIMIDTMLGDNDDAPFRIPNVGAVETERTFTGSEIPEYYQVFDSLENPSVISFGTFDKTSSNKADYVQFISWLKSKYTTWDVQTTDGDLIGDSSVTSVWNPKTLNPGETRTYKMYYGLGKFVADTSGELQLAGYGDNTAKVNESNTGYEPSTVTAYIKNSGENTLENVTVTLNAAEEMTFSDEETINIGNLSAGEEKQVSWTVNFAPSPVEKTVNYSISAKADNVDEKTVDLSTILPAITEIEATPDEPTTVPETTVPETTVEPTTVEPTTVAPTTTPDATSATKQATVDTAAKTTNNNAVQTGSVSVAALLLTALSAFTGIAYFVRKREND
ncbi:hypothetical protein [Ruminococcus sp.]|uniref:hypothetical protein n=1 Tax=Ruminococcus sp. TaxID=41978 RepID=UPI003EFDBAE0